MKNFTLFLLALAALHCALSSADDDYPYVKASQLLGQVMYNLNRLQEGKNGYNEKHALLSYNALRELIGEKPVESWKDIDERWFLKQAYKVFKQERLKRFKALHISLIDQILWLISDVKRSRAQLESNPNDSYYQRRLLFSYNLLRELTGEKPVESWKDIDEQWFLKQESKVFKEAYEVFKEERLKWLETFYESSIDQILRLLSDIKGSRAQLESNPNDSYYQRRLLFSYNLLRELTGEKLVESLKDIDQQWILQVEPSAFAKNLKFLRKSFPIIVTGTGLSFTIAMFLITLMQTLTAPAGPGIPVGVPVPAVLPTR